MRKSGTGTGRRQGGGHPESNAWEPAFRKAGEGECSHGLGVRPEWAVDLPWAGPCLSCSTWRPRPIRLATPQQRGSCVPGLVGPSRLHLRRHALSQQWLRAKPAHQRKSSIPPLAGEQLPEPFTKEASRRSPHSHHLRAGFQPHGARPCH